MKGMGRERKRGKERVGERENSFSFHSARNEKVGGFGLEGL